MAGDTTRVPPAAGALLPLRMVGARIGGTLWRLARLGVMYARLDLSLITADIRLVLVYLFSDAITNIAAITGMLLLSERFAGIGPWNQQQVTFMLGYATTVSGILSTCFGYNVLLISRRIGRGQLDHTLVQPQPIWLSLLTEGFMPFSGAAVLLPGIGLMVWGGMSLGVPITAGWVALLLLNLLASAVCVLAFAFSWGSLAFWAPRAAEEISASANTLLEQLKSFPLEGIGPLLLGTLLTVVPVGFVAWYPCRALLGIDTSPSAGWITPLAAILLAAFATFCFQKGLQRYARTGSQRYSDLGHRG